MECQNCPIGWLLETKSQNPDCSGNYTCQQFDISNDGILVTMATRIMFCFFDSLIWHHIVLFFDSCFLYALKNTFVPEPENMSHFLL